MNKHESISLVDKAVRVIDSCDTLSQLSNAINYANLLHDRLSKGIGLVNQSRFHQDILMALGRAQCRTNHG